MLISTIEQSEFGLEPGAEPVRKIKARTGRKTMPGWFPTRKGVNGSIRVESTLEMDGLSQYEVNPDCALMAGQPHHLNYWEPQADGTTIKRVYTPDLAVRMVSGAIAVIDFKVARYAALPAWKAKAALIREAYATDHQVIFETITDEEIRIVPRYTNVQVMLAHRSILNVRDDEAIAALSSAILAIGLPTTIAEISRAVNLPSPNPEIDRAFSGLMEMAIEGQIALDLGHRISPATGVRPRDGFHLEMARGR